MSLTGVKEFQTDGAATLKASRPALDSLWRGTISSFLQTDRRCLRAAMSATNVLYAVQEDTGKQWHVSSDKSLP